jgi:glutamate-ammonia-ligase adenylyltransferase
LPRGADPTTHLKLGRGALADVEWTVQLLQLRHGHRVEGLRTTRTATALGAAVDAGLLTADDGAALLAAWRLASRLRNAITLVRGRPADTLPSDPPVRAAVAALLGYPAADTERLADDYRRTTRRSRAAVERVFYA